ncbi:MAG TPA: RdgB/HAM1 family non-canonical purine NTP pyrophosphatase [Gammaproteobacteria bacterium]|nr:RdgB/HAM1 family non-canonical purine NTP pyrophosphatase [Gammaproteobacteria bacterium]
MNKLILATGNAGKIKEMTELLRPLQIEVIPQAELNISDAEEPGLTFVENALLKARHAARISGLPALADDSGLAVDALHGRPGIHSARYAGTPASSQKNIDKLLDEMKLVPSDKRQAQFHCVLALLTSADDPTPIICDGIWRGMILQQPQGDGGFGYDPVFLVPTENKSASQLAPDVKNKLSHRGKALRMLIQILKESQNC